MIHGGLRYLRHGQLAVAWESARERHILMTTTAPHLVHPLPFLAALNPSLSPLGGVLTEAGVRAGDILRLASGTRRRQLPGPRRIGAPEARRLVSALRVDGLRGGILFWDGQLEDDARLVIAVARTAAAHGAAIVTRCAALRAEGGRVWVRDEIRGATFEVRARTVVNAAGVWAGSIDPSVRLRPSKGSHLVVDAAALGEPRAALVVPVPGASARWVGATPAGEGKVIVGVTDDAFSGPIDDEPAVSEAEELFLLRVLSSALRRPLTAADVLGRYAGFRPLLDTGAGSTADLSRSHSIAESADGTPGDGGGRQAHHLPAHGRRTPSTGWSRGTEVHPAAPRRCRWSGPTAGGRLSGVPRGWCAATAARLQPSPSWRRSDHRCCSLCSPGATSSRSSFSSACCTRGRWASTTCSTGACVSAWSRRSAAAPRLLPSSCSRARPRDPARPTAAALVGMGRPRHRDRPGPGPAAARGAWHRVHFGVDRAATASLPAAERAHGRRSAGRVGGALRGGAVCTGDDARLRHAAGRSYADLLALRGATLEEAPDAVVSPGTEAEVDGVLRLCASASCAVVPFGGGTSVVGGVRPLRGEHRAVIVLDTRRLNTGVAVDPVSMTAVLGAGMTGPQAEAFLAGHGMTLGHCPQSFEYATLGGFAATRSAGQASSGYGRFDDLVEGVRAGHPVGPAGGRRAPRQRRGPIDPSARPRLRGTPRGDHRAHREGAAPARRTRATKAGPSRPSGTGSPRLRRLAQERAPPTSPG